MDVVQSRTLPYRRGPAASISGAAHHHLYGIGQTAPFGDVFGVVAAQPAQASRYAAPARPAHRTAPRTQRPAAARRLLAALVAPEFHILHADALNGFNAPPGHHTPGVQRPSHLIVNAHMAFVDALGNAQQLVDLFFLTAREAVDAHLPPGIQRGAARAGHLEHIIQLAHGCASGKVRTSSPGTPVK